MDTLRVATGWVGAAAVGTVGLLAIVTLVVPQATGPLALVQIFVLHLILVGILVGGLVALFTRTPAIVLALALLVGVGALRSASEMISFTIGSASGIPVRVVTWNIEWDLRRASPIADPLLEHGADVVSLQELTPSVAAALDADARIRARYPYRMLHPQPGALGLGILSAYPIVDHATWDDPVGLLATIDLGAPGRLAVLDAHPLPGRIRLGPFKLPVSFDGRFRDAEIERIRPHIDDLVASGTPFIVAGDFNTSPTEPAYGRLAAGLRDVHVDVGMGPGWTWRPRRFEAFGIGLLRIDLVLAGGGVRPSSIAEDCGNPGDHCIVEATVALP